MTYMQNWVKYNLINLTNLMKIIINMKFMLLIMIID